MKNTLIYGLLVLTVLSAALYAQDNYNIEQLSRIYNQWDRAYEVVVVENYAYIAAGLAGLQIVALSGDSLETVGYWDDNCWNAKAVAVRDDVAYLIDEESGMHIIDVSNPETPTEISNYLPRTNAIDIEIWQDIACVVLDMNDTRFFQILDIRNPSQIEEVTDFQRLGLCYDMEFDSGFLYVGSDSLIIYDLSDLENIHIEGGYGWEYDRSGVYGLTVEDSLLYACIFDERRRFIVVNISDPDEPVEVGTTGLPIGAGDVVIEGEYAYVANDRSGLVIYDVSNPIEPVQVGICATGDVAKGAAILEDYVILASSDWDRHGEYGTVNLIDISDVTEPFQIDRIIPTGYALNVSSDGEIVLLANETGGVQIVDVADLANPVHIGNINTEFRVWTAIAYEELVYIAENEGGLRIVDISNPDSVAEVSTYTYEGRGYVSSIQILNDIAFLTDTRRLIILDISNPSQPVELGVISAPDSRDVQVDGNTVFVAERQIIGLYDISELDNPSLITSVELPEGASANEIGIHNEFIFIAGGEAGVIVYDISNNDPQLTSIFNSPGYARGIEVIEERVYLADRESGIIVLDASNPGELIEIGQYNTPGLARGISIDGDVIYIADGTNLGIYQFTDPNNIRNGHLSLPTGFAIESVYPNPFNSTTTIKFALPFASEVALNLYNLSGQRIETLVNGRMLAGVHQTMLDGGDMASGLYFLKLEVDFQSFTQKLMIIR